MKRALCLVALVIMLVGCAQEDLPPLPPPPGSGAGSVGKAIGGLEIREQLPSWAAQIKYTDISPETVEHNQIVTVTVERPNDLDDELLVFADMYAYNSKYGIWEKVKINRKESGRIRGDLWATNEAVFDIPISKQRFETGMNYVVTYWCIDTDRRDADGKKIWECNRQKWGLGAFRVKGPGWPDILIEEDIENNRYQSSQSYDAPEGTAYLAKYIDLSKIETDVEVIELDNPPAFKERLATRLGTIQSQWTTRGQVCGFLQEGTDITAFSWQSGKWWITVTTKASFPDDAKIGKYGIKYPSDCNLLDDLKLIAAGQPGSCGNNVNEAGEECDMDDDAACPGMCRPDCSCMPQGQSGSGVCGDLIVQAPNSNGAIEQCEPPTTRDPVTGTVVSGSLCHIRDVRGNILSAGHCGNDCMCQPGIVFLPKCGNGKCEADEDYNSCAADCLPPKAPACTDSDGVDYYTKGVVTKQGVDTQDVCLNNVRLEEQTCDGPEIVECEFGCTDGACNPAEVMEYCPDAISVWSHDDTTYGRNIWYSLYWDQGKWAAPAGQVKTGEAASLVILDGFDNDPDIDTRWAGACGEAVAVWSHAETKEGGHASVLYSTWSWTTGWSEPRLVAETGYDPAVATSPRGEHVAVWVQSTGLFGSVFDQNKQAWSQPRKIADGDVSIPQVAYNRGVDKWFVVWVSGSEARMTSYGQGVWDKPQTLSSSAQGGRLVLPETRTGIDSQWQGKQTIAAWGSKGIVEFYDVLAQKLEKVDGMVSPDVDFDFGRNAWHLLGKDSPELSWADAPGAATQGPGTQYPDGRPAHTYVRVTDADVAVWHSNEEQPYFNDVFWSRRDAQGWSSPKRLVSQGLPTLDRNPDIAPLWFEIISEPGSGDGTTSKPRKPSVGQPGIGFPQVGGGGPGPNGNGNGNGGGNKGGPGGGAGGGAGGAGGGEGAGAGPSDGSSGAGSSDMPPYNEGNIIYYDATTGQEYTYADDGNVVYYEQNPSDTYITTGSRKTTDTVGQAIRYELSGAEKSGAQGLLIVLASLGIVGVTLFNVLRRE